MEPARIVVDAVSLAIPGRALDLACGRGRNASFLAQRGWSVIGIDLVPVEIDGVEVRTLDLETREPLPFDDDAFDLVCIVHFLFRPLFAEARRVTRPGGLIASAIHTVRSTMNPKYTVAIGELRSIFVDWEILTDREDEIAEIVARKPQGSSAQV